MTVHAKIAVLGAGPCGLQAVDELINCGVEPSDVLVVDPTVPQQAPVLHHSRLTIASSFVAAQESGGMAKSVQGDSVELSGSEARNPVSPSRTWGASCLPPHPSLSALCDSSAFWSKYETTISQLRVQAEFDALQTLYPLTGEQLGRLPRNPLATSLVDRSSTVLGHSRLAVSTVESDGFGACIGCGECFQGCAEDAPWSPDKGANVLKSRYPDLRWLSDSVRAIRRDARGALMMTNSGDQLEAEYALVATGWLETARLVGGAWNVPSDPSTMTQSSVIMMPVLLRGVGDQITSRVGVAYHDLVMPLPPTEQFPEPTVTQIYLPSAELAGRLMSRAPAFSHGLVSGLLERRPLQGSAARSLSHVAVAMTFVPGGPWRMQRSTMKSVVASVSNGLVEALTDLRPIPIRKAATVLDQGESHHVGAWEAAVPETLRLLEGEAPSANRRRVIPIDTAALPAIPPGPHTVSAAALARLRAHELVQSL